MENRGPNGAVANLRAGDYTATAAASGAMLGTVRWQDRDMVVPVDLEKALPVAYQGKSLIPWPNRIAGGAYTFDGERYEVPINEHDTGTALHGLGCWQEWHIVEQSESAVTFALDLLPSYGYPFSLHVTTSYALDERGGLTAATTATNTGSGPAPYGVSTHPYLTCGGTIDDCTLTLPAGRILQVDEALCPDYLEDVRGAGVDFREGRIIGDQFVDNAFTELPEGTWEVTLERPGDFGVTMSASVPWVQFYSGEHLARAGAAIEPMTCAPDAFNSGEGLIVLEPGQQHSFEWTLSRA